MTPAEITRIADGKRLHELLWHIALSFASLVMLTSAVIAVCLKGDWLVAAFLSGVWTVLFGLLRKERREYQITLKRIQDKADG